MTLRIHGIKSCDSCRKARKWLESQSLDHDWIDLRESPLSRAHVERWLDALGPEALVNRRSTSWRALEKDDRPDLDSPAVVDLLVEHPTLIKRPLFERDGDFRTGFGDDQRQWLLNHGD